MLRRNEEKKNGIKNVRKRQRKKNFVLTENEIFSFDALNCVLREYEILRQWDEDNINFYIFFLLFSSTCVSAPPVI